MAEDPDLRDLSRLPLIAAPMAGGASTVTLVTAAADAGALGFLAGGYKAPEDLRADIEAVRAATTAPFGVNLFVPAQPNRDASAVARYVEDLRPLAVDLGVEVGQPSWDDDAWDAKVELVGELRPSVVSFTFGCPGRDIIAGLRASGVHVAITVTSPDEARLAEQAGASSLCVQGPEAGGHRGSFTNTIVAGPGLAGLLGEIRRVTDLPLVAAGGLAGPDDVAAVLGVGAVAAQVGTALLHSPESGAPEVHQRALADPSSPDTVVTRAFSGRPARGVYNQFIADHPNPPAAYPEVNNATRPLRAAAARRGDASAVHLWAGTGYRQTRTQPVADILSWLNPSVPRR
jgi:nitronate monooxygenase